MNTSTRRRTPDAPAPVRYHERQLEVGGRPLFTRIWERPGPPRPLVVLVHGLVVSSEHLVPTAERLADRFRVLAPDLPGYGRSRGDGPVSVPQLGAALLDWARAAGLQRACWLANSFGCQVLTEAALRRPLLFERIVLVGPTVDPTARTVPRILHRWRQESATQSRALQRLLVREYARAGVRRAVATLQAALRDRPEDRLPYLDMPALVLRGADDPVITPAWAREVARRLPRGRLTTVPDAPHAMSFDAPAALLLAARPFLDGQDDVG